MIQLIVALIAGIATVVAAYIGKKETAPGGTATPTPKPRLSRIVSLFVVGGIAGALIATTVVEAARKGLLIAGYQVPVGIIEAYMGNSAPDGWLLCNGDPVPDDPAHAKLKSMLPDGQTPDLRGRFLRGLDPTGKVDIDGKGTRALGRPQEDAFKQHEHSIPDVLTTGRFNHVGGGPNEVQFRPTSTGDSPTGGTETRPKNVAVNFIIKY